MPEVNPAKERQIAKDVIIVGGGPAGLSAALLLGRARREVVVFDAGHPRNESSRAMHGYLSRDGTPPAEFLQICKDELGKYPTVEWIGNRVVHVDGEGDCFSAVLENGSRYSARSILLAAGVVDTLPLIEGIENFYGVSVHHCPYCDGWERRDQRLAVAGRNREAVDLALELVQWSRDVMIFTDGLEGPELPAYADLQRESIKVVPGVMDHLEGEDRQMRGLRMASGEFIERDALFFSPDQWQRSPFAAMLGCEVPTPAGSVECGEEGGTKVRGVFVAGNTRRGLQMVIMAAAEGAASAKAINEYLLELELAARRET